MTTPIFTVEEIYQHQDAKEQAHSRILRALEAPLGRVITNIATEPTSPVDGDIYAVIGTATLEFTGKENHFAYYEGGVWTFTPIKQYQVIFNKTTKQKLYFDGTDWQVLHDLPAQPVETGNITGNRNSTYLLDGSGSFTLPVGIDEGDRMTIVDYNGTFGTTNLIVNRSGSNTVIDNVLTSVTLDVDYSVTEFIFNNNIWRVMLGVGDSTGGGGGTAYTDVLSADVDYYVDASTGNDSNDGSMGSPFLTIQKALDTLDPRYLKIHDINIILNGTFNITDANRVILGKYRSITGKAILRGQSAGSATLSAQVGFTQEGNNYSDGGVITVLEGSHWEIADLVISTSSAASTNAIGIKVRDYSQLTMRGTIDFNDGSSGGNDCIRVDNRSNVNIVEPSGTTNIRFTATSNFVRYAFHIDRDSTVFVDSNSQIEFSASNSIVAGGAFVFAEFNSGYQMNGTYLGTLQGSGLRYDIDIISNIIKNTDPAGTLTTDSILQFSEVL